MILGFLLGIGASALFAFFYHAYYFAFTIVSGSSMSPTLRNKDVLTGDRQFALKRGDIISFISGPKKASWFTKRKPGFQKDRLIKRVIALPGDMIEIKKGKVFINGFQIYEDYVFRFSKDDYPLTRVPEGMIFVLGDNRNHSRDSRDSSIGFVRIDNVICKYFMRNFPLKSYGYI